MKGSLDRTKVVARHLPPTISQSNLVEHIDSRFLGRYHWLSFQPGKSGLKHLTHSRVYIDFNRPEDVIEFAEFFNGHVFVNEKGAQFKATVEYAPSQRVPKQCFKKDGREGTLLKDTDYTEFLEFIAKPIENLPSAEIQLERKESERAGAPKNVPIVTPLMEYVRQKRIARVGARRTVLNGKTSRKVGRISSKSPISGSLISVSEKRTSTTMYPLRDSTKGVGGKDKSTYLLVPKHNDQHLVDKSVALAAVSGTNIHEGEAGASGPTGIVKKILLLKGKAKESSNVPGGSSLQQNASVSAQNSHSSAPFRHNQRRETNGGIIRTIILNKNTRQNQSSPGSQSELRIQASIQDRDKKPPRSPGIYSLQKETNGVAEEINSDALAVHTEKQQGQTKNKDRPDRGIMLLSSASQTSQVLDSEDVKNEMLVTRASNYRPIGNGRNGQYSAENGSYRNGGRRGLAYNARDGDTSFIAEGKPFKRGGSSGYGSQEKQLWIQKSSSGP